ncbi:MAG TPA: hypothetical protein VFJ28_13635 [Marmoricola sp.]|nr:hypothetical protein [Marmoricola sp.]
MGGCESLSAPAGSFAHDLLLDTERFGVPARTVEIDSPRSSTPARRGKWPARRDRGAPAASMSTALSDFR